MCHLLQVNVPEAHGRMQNLPRTRVIACHHSIPLPSMRSLKVWGTKGPCPASAPGSAGAEPCAGRPRGTRVALAEFWKLLEPSLEDAQRVSKLA